MPPRVLGNREPATGAFAVLFSPEHPQFRLLALFRAPFPGLPFLEVNLPVWVLGSGFSNDLDGPFNGYFGTVKEMPFLTFLGNTEEYPIVSANGLEVVLHYPSLWFVGMSSFRPLVHSLPYGVVDFPNDFLA